MNIRAIARLGAAAIVNALYFASGYLFADPVSKDEAVAMVQKAVAAIREGLCRDQQSGGQVRRPQRLHRSPWARRRRARAWRQRLARWHQPDRGRGPRRQGVRERACRSRQATAELLAVLQIHESDDQEGRAKQMYCERLDETAVCGGIYQ